MKRALLPTDENQQRPSSMCFVMVTESSLQSENDSTCTSTCIDEPRLVLHTVTYPMQYKRHFLQQPFALTVHPKLAATLYLTRKQCGNIHQGLEVNLSRE